MELRSDMKVTSTLLMFYFSGDKCDKTISVHLKYIAEISLHLLFIYLFMRAYVCGGQSHGYWFSPSSIWVPGLELRLSGLAASPCPAAPSYEPPQFLNSNRDTMLFRGGNRSLGS